MAVIHDLIKQIDDETLRKSIMTEVDKLSKQKKFGLVFEEHLPECTPLYDVEIRKNSKVALRTGQVSDIYIVRSINGDKAICEHKIDHAEAEFALDDLVAIAEFGEPIYPYLQPIDAVCNAPDSELWHTLIEADNYHALQLLEYLYAGKVDCIYIDPPYNTGAKDWKYNNDYVDSSDVYRHSKWLSMMEKRLKLAKKILNPKDSVLVVTIDEKEYLHLGCLLEEMFPNANIQMVTDIVNPKGVSRGTLFSRAEEYLFFVFLGEASINVGTTDMLRTNEQRSSEIRWASLQRSGSNSRRYERPNLFYPIFFNKESGKFVSVGESVPLGKARDTVFVPDDQIAVFPLGRNNDERTWQLAQDTFISLLNRGYVRFGNWQSNGRRTISYLSSGLIRQIENSEIQIVGYEKDGTVILSGDSKVKPLTVWNRSSHSASDQGSSLISNILCEKRFTFPKSVYAVKDTLGFCVSEKPDALVVDFFAGSGTTLHAVNLLNSEDSGNRRCIMVTNNEVSEGEAKALIKQSKKPGDEEWERFGIARYVTWPRTVCSIEGHDVNGNPLRGNYLGIDKPMSEGFKANAAYFKLGFLDKAAVCIGRQFKEMLPTLWMKAGCFGPCPTLEGQRIPDYMILTKNRMAILNDNSCFAKFVAEVGNTSEIETVYLVTDSDDDYRSMVKVLNVKNTYQLYKDYLDNFRINSMR